jgi:2-polyprenyl-6-methoxyphenol hydroxylase-like FAD-dependent oxidoreductase
MSLKIAIAGGGVGGLSAAVALRQYGHDVQLYEKATSFSEVGAGVSLWPNALAALSRLGLEDQVMARGQWENEGAIRSKTGAELRSVENTNLIILRSVLQQILLAELVEIPTFLDARCIGVTSPHSRPVLRFEDGRSVECDLVIGADGIRSAVRQSIAPHEAKARYTGLCAWRALVEAPGLVENAWLSIGDGLQFMAAPLPGGHVYWSPLVRLDEGDWAQIDNHRHFLTTLFSAWHEPIPTLLGLTAEAACFPTPVYFRPPPRWLTHGRVVLIGDAAHPMTPDLGQGACQAIEDAVVLADCIAATSENVDLAVSEFASRRLPRIRRVVRGARQLGLILAEGHRPLTHLRAGVLRLTPAGFTEMRLSAITAREAFHAQLTAAL